MKKLLAICALAVSAAYGNIVPRLTVEGGGPSCVGTGTGQECTYNYTATLHRQTMLTNEDDGLEFFTIFDFHGYIDGSATGPEGWDFYENAAFALPDLVGIPEDDPDSSNLTWVYVGDTDFMNGGTFTGFSARSSFGPGIERSWYASQAKKQGDKPGSTVQNVGPIWVPEGVGGGDPGDEVPEPMSMALFGTGLIAIGFLRYKKN